MKPTFPDTGNVETWKCPNCKSEIVYASIYIEQGLQQCTSRVCRAEASIIGEKLVKALGYTFMEVETKSSRKVFKFKCNNGHNSSMYFEALRNGKICPDCSKLRDVMRRTLHSKKAPPVPKTNCNCKEKGLCYGVGLKLCEHYNFKVLCPVQASEWSQNNQIGPEMVAPKCNSAYLFNCSKCFREYSCLISERFKGTGCPYCNGNHKLPEEKSLSFKHPELLEEWDPENNFKPSDIHAGSEVTAKWICKFGHKWETKILSRTSGKTGCPVCNGNGLTKCQGAHEKFVKESSVIHNNKYLYPEEYISSKTKIRIVCPIHGDFYQIPGDHRSGHGCYTCGTGRRITEPVRKIITKFEELGYECRTEVSFPGLKHINALAADIVVPNLNLVIEYDGKQHFKPIKSWGGQEALNNIIIRDRCKDKYFLEKGISFVRIACTQNETINIIIEQIIEKVKSSTIYISYKHHFSYMEPIIRQLPVMPLIIIY